jgi:ribosome-binding factor A
MKNKQRSTGTGPSQRQLRVGEQLRHIIAQTLQRGHFRDEILIDSSADITVTEVRPSPDLKQATAYVISLGGKNMDEFIPALNNNAAQFQKDIGTQNTMKFTPKVRFKADTSYENVQKLENIFDKIEYSDQEKE